MEKIKDKDLGYMMTHKEFKEKFLYIKFFNSKGEELKDLDIIESDQYDQRTCHEA